MQCACNSTLQPAYACMLDVSGGAGQAVLHWALDDAAGSVAWLGAFANASDAGWAGFGLAAAEDEAMADSDVALYSASGVLPYHVAGYVPAYDPQQQLAAAAAAAEGADLHVSVTRAYDNGGALALDPDAAVPLVFARGLVDSGPGAVGYHGPARRWAATVDLRTGELVSASPSTGGGSVNWMLVHALLMCAAWAWLVPFGVFAARHLRWLARGSRWFPLHRGATLAGVAVAAVGVGVAAAELDAMDTAHGVCGAVLMALAVLQPLNGMLRPPPGKAVPRRRLWEQAHKALGRFTLALAAVTVVLGLRLIHERRPDDSQLVSAVAGAGAGLFLAAMLSMELWRIMFPPRAARPEDEGMYSSARRSRVEMSDEGYEALG